MRKSLTVIAVLLATFTSYKQLKLDRNWHFMAWYLVAFGHNLLIEYMEYLTR